MNLCPPTCPIATETGQPLLPSAREMQHQDQRRLDPLLPIPVVAMCRILVQYGADELPGGYCYGELVRA